MTVSQIVVIIIFRWDDYMNYFDEFYLDKWVSTEYKKFKFYHLGLNKAKAFLLQEISTEATSVRNRLFMLKTESDLFTGFLQNMFVWKRDLMHYPN